jgi:2-keto-4-pentenoate hydratase
VISVTDIATELLHALDTGRTVTTISAREPAFGWEQAYAVAAQIVKQRRARGEQTVGRKIGFTNRNIWPEYGATSPIWAHVYDDTVYYAKDNVVLISLKGSVRPRIEPEIAFKLRVPVPLECRDPARILECLEWLAPSFEIVDCHFPEWKFTPADSAADFSFHWRLIIGEPYGIRRDEIPALARQLKECKVTLSRDGKVVDRGVGSNALDHPALALAFLADIVGRQTQFDTLGGGRSRDDRHVDRRAAHTGGRNVDFRVWRPSRERIAACPRILERKGRLQRGGDAQEREEPHDVRHGGEHDGARLRRIEAEPIEQYRYGRAGKPRGDHRHHH